jgi:flagellar motor switch protein FliG
MVVGGRIEAMSEFEESTGMSGSEKAAALLMFLGEDISVDVLRELDEEEIRQVVSKLPFMTNLPPESMEEVVKEFNERIQKEGFLSQVGKDFVENIISKALDEKRADKMIKKLSYAEKLENIKKHDTRTIFNLIKKEHPQTIAFILSHLAPTQTSEIIAHLPEDLRFEVVLRIARMDQVVSGAMEEVIDALSRDISAFRVEVGESVGGIKDAAEVLNSMRKSDGNEIIRRIEEDDPDLAEEIGQYMFVFEDLLNVDDKGIQMILREVSNDDLAVALKMASDEVKDKLFRNISTRAAEMIQEDMESRGPVRISDVEKSQQVIIRIARKLEMEGKIVVAGRGGEDMFV